MNQWTSIRKLIYKDNCVLVPLTQDKFAKINFVDAEWVGRYNWYFRLGYAVRSRHPLKGQMHRLVNRTPEHLETDHIDGNKLNNLRHNLRNSTRTQNNQNRRKTTSTTTSKYKGVQKTNLKDINKGWCACIRVDGKLIGLGSFTKEITAAKAYDKAAKKHFGRFAKLNFKGNKS